MNNASETSAAVAAFITVLFLDGFDAAKALRDTLTVADLKTLADRGVVDALQLAELM